MRQASQPPGELGPREQLEASTDFLDAKRAPFEIIESIQTSGHGPCLRSIGQLSELGEFPAGQRLTSEEQDRLEALQGGIPRRFVR